MDEKFYHDIFLIADLIKMSALTWLVDNPDW